MRAFELVGNTVKVKLKNRRIDVTRLKDGYRIKTKRLIGKRIYKAKISFSVEAMEAICASFKFLQEKGAKK